MIRRSQYASMKDIPAPILALGNVKHNDVDFIRVADWCVALRSNLMQTREFKQHLRRTSVLAVDAKDALDQAAKFVSTLR